jgi:hypothetical protein
MSDNVATPAQANPEAGQANSNTPNPTAVTPPAGQAAAQTQTPTEPVKPVVPEKYDLKMPEGFLLGEGYQEKIASYARERGFSNDQAQELLNREHQAATQYHESIMSNLKQTQDSWVSAVKADPEIGGSNFQESVRLAKLAIDKFGSDGLRNELNTTRYGDHPEVVRMFSRIGKLIADDKLVQSNAQQTVKKSHAELLYGPEKKG